MKVKFPLSVLILSLCLPPIHAQNAPNMGVAIQNTEHSSDKTATVHLLNISDKEVTAFSLSVRDTLPDGKTLPSSGVSEDMLGGYLMTGKAFSPGSTRDVQMGGEPTVQIPKPVSTTLVVDVVVYGDGTAQVQNQDAFKNIMDLRTARVRTLEQVDDAIEKVAANPAAEHPTASVVALLKAVQDADQKKADTANTGSCLILRNIRTICVTQGGGSPGEHQLESEIRDLTRFVNRNQEAPLNEMLQHNKSELAKLTPHVHITEIQ